MLSVVIPAFNEVDTLPRVLIAVSKALPTVEKEVLLVDDGSVDGTREWINANFPDGHRSGSCMRIGASGNLECIDEPTSSRTTIRALYHERNLGKGASLRTGLAAANGQVIVIQDADLEYDPSDWTVMYDLIANQKVSDVVYGSRFRGRHQRSPYFLQPAANRLISSIFSFVYNTKLTDIEVCYKMFTTNVKKTLNITCTDFGCEIQMSAQIVRPGHWRIREVDISYRGRTYEQGKKIDWRDGLKALWYLVRFRIFS